MKNIGFDFDGVISNCALLKSHTLKALYGIDIPPEDFRKEAVVGRHITLQKYRLLQKLVYETRGVGLRLEPVQGALEVIQRLLSIGHSVTVITSRSEAGVQIAKEWTQINGLEINLVGAGKNTTKAPLCLEHRISHFFDDDYHKLEPLAGIVPHRFLLSTKHNLHIETDEAIGRVSTWEEIEQIVLSL